MEATMIPALKKPDNEFQKWLQGVADTANENCLDLEVYIKRVWPEDAQSILKRRNEIFERQLKEEAEEKKRLADYFTNRDSMTEKEQVITWHTLQREIEIPETEENLAEDDRIDELGYKIAKELQQKYSIKWWTYLGEYDSCNDFGEDVLDNLFDWDGITEEFTVTFYRRQYLDTKFIILARPGLTDDEITDIMSIFYE